ncbi:hypothetical protein Tco_1045303 [Tanacetum coccineum]|uniref:Harbinger transposase-derived protein n=1 Tax=Tanacetum coccineum TaxID=301880 RepID=A0ABQ5GUU2_9ASTR
MCDQEAGGSGSAPKRTRTYIPRVREEVEQRQIDDYFGDDETPPKYPEENFWRRYRMSSILFNKIVNAILSYNAQPLPEYFYVFRQRYDDVGRLSIGPILKCTSVIRQLAYDAAPDAFDEYLQIIERLDIEKTYALHEEKHGLLRMLGSIDCMHWEWKNCPRSLHGQIKRCDHKYPTLMLQAAADQNLWIWHTYFGVTGENNDLNVLYGSPLFDDELAD